MAATDLKKPGWEQQKVGKVSSSKNNQGIEQEHFSVGSMTTSNSAVPLFI